MKDTTMLVAMLQAFQDAAQAVDDAAREFFEAPGADTSAVLAVQLEVAREALLRVDGARSEVLP